MDAHKNFAYSTVATAPSPATTGTSLVVAAGQGALFPTAPFNATVWPAGTQPLTTNAEIIRVTARTTDTLTITRGQESSTARSIVVGDQIAATITAKTLTDVEALTLTATGDATGTLPGALTLASVGGGAGSVGDGHNIPGVTVDAKGRVLGLTTNVVEGHGVWTDFSGSASLAQSSTLSVTPSYAKYTVFGKTCIYNAIITINSAGTANTVLRSNIPFSFGSGIPILMTVGVGDIAGFGGNYHGVSCVVNAASEIAFFRSDINTNSLLMGQDPNAAVGAGAVVRFTITYETT